MGQTERVALYARVSTEMQAEEGFSIEAQLNEMRAYAAQRGWRVVAEFVDAGISGSTMDRPGLRALLEAAQAHQFDVVLVHELSRLSRSVFDTFEIFEQLGQAQVGFASVREPQFNLLDPHGRFFLTMIASINQYYLDMLRLHTQKSKRERARQGLYNASVAPYGYRHVGDARTPPVVVEEEAKVVRRVFEMYATGRYTCRQIAEVLNGEGYRTRSGRRFSKDGITEMLRNPFYIGKVTYREGRRGEVEVYDGLHEPIISEELWEAAARVRNQQTVRRVLRGEKRPYLLGGIARCHTCGRRLRAQGAQAGDYYRDTTVLTGYDDCPYGQSGVRAEVVHEQVGRILRGLRLPEEWREEMAALVGEDEEAGTLRSRRERLIAERRRLKRAYLAGDFDEDEDIYREHLERIREELARLPTEDDLKRIGEAARVLETVGEVWDEAEEADRRDLVQLILREVEVDMGQGRLVALKPHAPFIPLFRTMAGVEEREFGVFVPVWPVEEGGVVGHRLEAVREVGEGAVALPFVVKWPWEVEAEARVSPTVSALLKERRSGGKEGGRVVVVPRAGVPEVRVDGRKWPGVRVEEMGLEEALGQKEGTVAVLVTPLALQEGADRGEIVRMAWEVLEEWRYWFLVDILPVSMAGHWVFRVFPGAWKRVEKEYWSGQEVYRRLREVGFAVEMEEWTFWEGVSVGAALKVVRRRPGILGRLSEEEIRVGVERLERMKEERGEGEMLSSEVTLMAVVGRKGGRAAQKFRLRRLVLDKILGVM
jgi:site-specific DNA recombinase